MADGSPIREPYFPHVPSKDASARDVPTGDCVFCGRGRASGGPDRRGEPIPVVPRVSKLVIGPAQGRVVGRSRSHLRSRLEPAVSRIGSICRKRTCFRPVIYLARIDVGLTTAKRRWEGGAKKSREEDFPKCSALPKRSAPGL